MVWPKGVKPSLETREKIRLANTGKKRSDETKAKLRLKKLGDKNPMWKGDDISYIDLHIWVRKHLPKPRECESCGGNKNLDTANITGVYTRDFINWKYLCRSCHMKSDGRMNNLKQYSF